METCDSTRVSASGKHKDCLIITLMLCIEKESTTCADYELDGLASENKRLLPTNLWACSCKNNLVIARNPPGRRGNLQFALV